MAYDDFMQSILRGMPMQPGPRGMPTPGIIQPGSQGGGMPMPGLIQPQPQLGMGQTTGVRPQQIQHPGMGMGVPAGLGATLSGGGVTAQNDPRLAALIELLKNSGRSKGMANPLSQASFPRPNMANTGPFNGPLPNIMGPMGGPGPSFPRSAMGRPQMQGNPRDILQRLMAERQGSILGRR